MQLITPRLQQGFTLLEGLLGLSVLIGVLVLGSQHLQRRLEEQFCRNAAAHLRIVTDAAERYVLEKFHSPEGMKTERRQWMHAQQKLSEDEYQTLESWRYQQLSDYLPEHFSKENLYGQSYLISVTRQEKPEQHYRLVLITIGGRPVGERALQQTARQLGFSGGYISSLVKDNGDCCITGSQKGWKLSLPNETHYRSPTSAKQAKPSPNNPPDHRGHLASLRLLYDGDRLHHTALLHRVAMPNDKKALNQMETDLNLQQHRIVFRNENTSGTLSASTMELASNDSKSKVTLAVDDNFGPTITLQDKNSGKLEITPNKVSFTDHKPPERLRLVKDHLQSVRAKSIAKTPDHYSPAELHRYWNKLAYYELNAYAKNDDNANIICRLENPEDSDRVSSLGRLFMLGFENSKTTYLYLCTNDFSKPAVLIKTMDPKS